MASIDLVRLMTFVSVSVAQRVARSRFCVSSQLRLVNVHVYSQRVQKYTKASRTQNVKSHAYTKHGVN